MLKYWDKFKNDFIFCVILIVELNLSFYFSWKDLILSV